MDSGSGCNLQVDGIRHLNIHLLKSRASMGYLGTGADELLPDESRCDDGDHDSYAQQNGCLSEALDKLFAGFITGDAYRLGNVAGAYIFMVGWKRFGCFIQTAL